MWTENLSNLAENTLIGATNAETGGVNSAVDYTTGKEDTIPEVAKAFKARKQPWVLVADHNYGEGSAREHAALQPRFFGCEVIVARSIARIAETNLRKQGVLTLLFADEADYELIGGGDKVSTRGLEALIKPGGDLSAQVTLVVEKPNGTVHEIATKHSLSKAHLDWIRAGSALNVIREQAHKESVDAKSAMNSAFASSSSSSRSPSSTRTFSTSARPLYAQAKTAAKGKGKPTGEIIRPGDPRYVAPAADARQENLRRMIFPPAAEAEQARKQHKIPTTPEDAYPFGAEVHTTIDRAWKLHERLRRVSLQEDLRIKRLRMHEAMQDLKKENTRLYRAATYRVSPNKRSPEEQVGLISKGVVPDSQGNRVESTSEEKRQARRMLGNRLKGMFPREMRVPTQTPSKKVWPES